MREDDATNIGDTKTGFSQAFMKGIIRCFCFRPGVDQRNRIFGDQINVNGTNIKRRRQ
jgi:hypothetical protein